MVAKHFAHVRTWVFDLDNTLYPPQVRLFDQIEALMRTYMARELGVDHPTADRLRAEYWATYGTTLAGLMAEHKVDPDHFLHEVHQIDFGVLPADPTLAARINALPGRKIVYTNGARPYALNVLAARGLTGLFDEIYGIEHAGYRPKPERAAFETVFGRDQLDPETAAMFEDDPRNLAVPHAMGMQTVHVAPAPHPADHIHHHTDDLGAFLSRVI